MMVKWVQVNTDWYYMDEHGVMVTGWLTIDDVKYYFAADGKMLIEEGDPINLSLKAIPDRYINEEYSQEYVIETLDKIQTPYMYGILLLILLKTEQHIIFLIFNVPIRVNYIVVML